MTAPFRIARCFSVGCSLLLLPSLAAELSHAEVEESLRIALSGVTGEYGHGMNYRPPHEFVLRIAAQGKMPHQEIQAILAKVIDEGVHAPAGDNGAQARRAASGAIIALAYIGDAAILERLVGVAETGPRELMGDAYFAVCHLATREAPGELPAIARRPTKNRPDSSLYGQLTDELERHLPSDPNERNRRIAAIMEVFKEGLLKAYHGDRISLDKLLEKYDPTFRHSAERRKKLTELSGSENPIVKNYAESKLRLEFPDSANASSDAATKVLPVSKKTAPSATNNSSDGSLHDDSQSQWWKSPYAVVGGVIALGIMALLLWKISSPR